MWSSRTPPAVPAGKVLRRPGPLGRRAQPRPQAAARVRLARDREVLVAHEVEQHHPVDLVGEAGAPRPCCRAGPSPRTRRRPRRAGSPRRRRRRTGASAGSCAGSISRASCSATAVPGRAVVRADEARDVLRVVVGARRATTRSRSWPGTLPDDVAQPAGDALVAAVRQPALRGTGASSRDAGEPAGRSPRRDLVLERLPRARRVEAGPVVRPQRRWTRCPRPRCRRRAASGTSRTTRNSRTGRLWPLSSAHDDSAQGPAQLSGRVLPPPGGARLAHARRRRADLRGAAARARGLPRADRLAPSPRPALPPEARVPALRDGPPGLGRRPALQPRLPRASYRAAVARRGRAAAPAGRPDLLPAPRPLEAAVGGAGSSRASRTTASRSSTRPITRSSTACRGWTSRPCCSTSRRSRRSDPCRRTTGHRRPSPPRRS